MEREKEKRKEDDGFAITHTHKHTPRRGVGGSASKGSSWICAHQYWTRRLS